MKQKITDIIFDFENGLIRAGMDASNVDYDIVSEVRHKVWKELEELLPPLSTNK